MESRNPVLTRQPVENPYGARPEGASLVDLDAVVTRTGGMFGILVAAAALTFAVKPGIGIVLVAVLAAFGLGLWITLSQTIRPAAILSYAAIEGVAVGGISYFYADAFGGNVVPQAVLGTLAAFTAMLVAYKTGLVRATPKFRKTLIIATIGYAVFALVHALGVVFGVWDSIYFGGGSSLLAVGVSLIGVVLAAAFLVLDFDQIEQAIRRGAPEVYAWRLAFGLIVTLVWLYLEMLRLIAILQGRD